MVTLCRSDYNSARQDHILQIQALYSKHRFSCEFELYALDLYQRYSSETFPFHIIIYTTHNNITFISCKEYYHAILSTLNHHTTIIITK